MEHIGSIIKRVLGQALPPPPTTPANHIDSITGICQKCGMGVEAHIKLRRGVTVDCEEWAAFLSELKTIVKKGNDP